jgi:hypothetical protein
MNIALQQALHERDVQADKLSQKLDTLTTLMGHGSIVANQDDFQWKRRDSPSPSIMMDPTDLNPPTFLVSPPEEEETENTSNRSPSPFSTRKPLERSLSE